MKLIADPGRLREIARKVDALASPERGVCSEQFIAGQAPAVWVDPPRVRQDRIVLYLHGGAFVAETPKFHGALVARICGEADARGLMPSYRLAPEHRYPAALDDCLSAYRWLLSQGHAANRIVVAGDSAGGNLTLALLLRARDEGLPLPACAVALSPVADLTFSGDSIRRNDGVDDMFSAELMDALVPVYLADRDLRTHPHVSPLFGDFAGLPPLLLIAGSTELLLDDSVRVAQRCPGARLMVWHGMPHVFPGFEFLREAREAVHRIGGFMQECLAEAAAPRSAPALQAAPSTLEQDAAPLPTPALPAPLSAGAWLYLALGIGSGLLSLSLLTVGPGPALLWKNPLLWAAAAAAVAFMLVESRSVGRRVLPWCLVATLALGAGCGLSLFLFLRSLRATVGGADTVGWRRALSQ
ncbi:MAG: alpha/beta hydrolase [Rhizobacter sp.]|nr:alpha/beta hydrolase [Rhizobacter sp.]